MKFKPGYVTERIFSYLNARLNTLSFKGIFAAIFQSESSKLKPADVLFWCHDNHRVVIVNGKKYAPLIDTLIDHIKEEFSHITLAGPFSKYFGDACYGNVVMYNRTLLFSYVYRLLKTRSFSIQNVNSDPVVIAWIKILKRIRPKAIIGITPSPELCIAARSLDIWIADMQHGILAPGNFYDVKKRSNINQQGWPDMILCWDQFSKDFVDVNLSEYVKSLVIGNPALFSKANKELVLSEVKDDSKKSEQISVLVTLTWHLPELYADDTCFKAIGMPMGLSEFIKIHGSFCNWNLRLHPAQVTKRKNEVFQNLNDLFKGMPNVNWETSNNETLFDSLNKCSVHITFDSASSREAAMKGIKTAILDLNEENTLVYFGDLIKAEKAMVISANEHDSLKRWIIQSNLDHIDAKEAFIIEMSKSQSRFLTFIDNFKLQLKNQIFI
jgi:hypothetical protein